MKHRSSGPLSGIRVIELAGIGPAPFCGMLLADMGADVVRVDKEPEQATAHLDPLVRNRSSILCNLKQPCAVEVVLDLVATADAFIEGFRPGVAERLGLGPDTCLERNPRLVYGRMTGWGQDGPLAQRAGHDLNYIALTGALNAIGPPEGSPSPPLNLVGDFGGGGMLLAFGVLCGILESRVSGKGQVVDAAMVDGVNTLMAFVRGLHAMGMHGDGTGAGFLSGAAHFYSVYETKDEKYVTLAPLEPKFYGLLIEKLGLDPARFGPHVFSGRADAATRANWKALKQEISAVIKRKTRAEWEELLQGTDVCFAPVLNLEEATTHPHSLHRRAFVDVGGRPQPAPAPRFCRTAPQEPQPGVKPGTHTLRILKDLGYSADRIDALLANGAVAQSLQSG